MTKEEAESLTTFDEICICGGFAWQLNGRPQADPHMHWCPQKPQYDERYEAMHGAKV